MNMIPVITSTNMDSPKIVLAGVVAGAKMLVELTRSAAKSADRKSSASMASARHTIEICPCRIDSPTRSVSVACLLALPVGWINLTLWSYVRSRPGVVAENLRIAGCVHRAVPSKYELGAMPMTNSRECEVAEQFLSQLDEDSFDDLFRIFSPQLLAFF